MKHLEKEKLQILLDIMGHNPSLRIAHFTHGGNIMIESLLHYCMEEDYTYHINCINDIVYKEISKTYSQFNQLNIREVPLWSKAYMIQAIQYDFVFVTCKIEKILRDDFLKKIYKIILNAGNLILFVHKGDIEERNDWIGLLEKNYYVASNTIDDLFAHYDIIISKKMHGWGNK
jgi:hypothetical protein